MCMCSYMHEKLGVWGHSSLLPELKSLSEKEAFSTTSRWEMLLLNLWKCLSYLGYSCFPYIFCFVEPLWHTSNNCPFIFHIYSYHTFKKNQKSKWLHSNQIWENPHHHRKLMSLYFKSYFVSNWTSTTLPFTFAWSRTGTGSDCL